LDTPAETVGRQRQERQDHAVASITRDAFIRDAIESLDASVVESSIKPIA
jgi:DNA polymerase-3 subunit gamma/tau